MRCTEKFALHSAIQLKIRDGLLHETIFVRVNNKLTVLRFMRLRIWMGTGLKREFALSHFILSNI